MTYIHYSSGWIDKGTMAAMNWISNRTWNQQNLEDVAAVPSLLLTGLPWHGNFSIAALTWHNICMHHFVTFMKCRGLQ